ncbi:MAG TPA: hypothetical protein VLM89_14100 [Phycisphaerae bacterium]|nr:hypothetical protein [Phycisphaerae bacterium]
MCRITQWMPGCWNTLFAVLAMLVNLDALSGVCQGAEGGVAADARWRDKRVDVIQPDGTVRHADLKEVAGGLATYGEEISAAMNRAVSGLSEEEMNRLFSMIRAPRFSLDLIRGDVVEYPGTPLTIDVRHDDLAKAQIALIERVLALRALECKLAPPLTADERRRLSEQVERVCGELAALHSECKQGAAGTQPADLPRWLGGEPSVENATRVIRTLIARQSQFGQLGIIHRPLDEKALDALIQEIREIASGMKTLEATTPSVMGGLCWQRTMDQVNLILRTFMRYPSSLTPEQTGQLVDLRNACNAAWEQILILRKKHNLIPENERYLLKKHNEMAPVPTTNKSAD